jgi:hypothetical protein
MKKLSQRNKNRQIRLKQKCLKKGCVGRRDDAKPALLVKSGYEQPQQKGSLFDHLVGEQLHRSRPTKTEPPKSQQQSAIGAPTVCAEI